MLGAYACECPTTSRPLVRDNVQRLEMGIALPVGEDGGDWCADARLRPAAWEQPHRARAEEYVRRRLCRLGLGRPEDAEHLLILTSHHLLCQRDIGRGRLSSNVGGTTEAPANQPRMGLHFDVGA